MIIADCKKHITSEKAGFLLSAPFLYPWRLLSSSCNVVCLNDAFMVAAWPNRSRGTRVVIPNENLTTVLPRIKPFSLRSSRFALATRLSLGERRARGRRENMFSRYHLERVQSRKSPSDGPAG